MRKLYHSPHMEVSVPWSLACILCSSDLTDDGGIPDLIDDEIDWNV